MPVKKKLQRKKSKQLSIGIKYKKSIRKHSFIYKLFRNIFLFFKKRYTNLISRRPHKSFVRTKRRDYIKKLDLPGYWSFTNNIRQLLWSKKGLFSKFVILYALLMGLSVGLISQDNYQMMSDFVRNIGTNVFEGNISDIGQNIAIFSGVLAGVFTTPKTEAQQIYAGLISILGWLTIVWLLRQHFAGHKKLKLRDGIYNSAAPLVSTFLIFMLLFVQIIPFALAAIAYVSAESVQVFDNVLFTTFFWIIELILVTLSIYWISSTFIALIIVTLPGMYPWKAVVSAGDLVVGRRLRILYRLAWMLFILLLIWIIVLLPLIVISQLIEVSWLPIVPLGVLLLSSFSIVWCSAYVYILYRKVVENDAS